MATETPTLFEQARECFARLRAEFAVYGLEIDPAMELREGSGLLCYYDLGDGHIYLSLPDVARPVGKLQALYMRSLLGLQTTDELFRLLGVFMPSIMAHEIAHHFRHRSGQFGSDLWHEEQVANRLAVAVTKHRLAPDDKAFLRRVIPLALDGLVKKLATDSTAADSYHSVLHALNALGHLSDGARESIELVQKLFGVTADEVLRESGQLPGGVLGRLEQRERTIEALNAVYASDHVQYFYNQLGWLYLALTSRETEYVDEFARVHLGRTIELLPAMGPDAADDDRAIRACFHAHARVQGRSEVAARYFYKRYRSLLLARLAAPTGILAAPPGHPSDSRAVMLERWSDAEADPLVYLAPLVPAPLRALFPQAMATTGSTEAGEDVADALPTDTDRRLWRHVVDGQPDEAAQNTLARLSLLDRTEVFRALPVEVALALTHLLCRVKVAAGEALVWEGDLNDDVYVLVAGRLEVVVGRDEQERRVHVVGIGEVTGEMAFLTGEPRSATLRAVVPSECCVLKSVDLRLLAFQHPSILMHMGAVLSKRLVEANRVAADAARLRSV